MNKFDSIYWHFYYTYFYELTNSLYACVMELEINKKIQKPKASPNPKKTQGPKF